MSVLTDEWAKFAAEETRAHRMYLPQCEECGLINGWHAGWCKTGMEAWERVARGASQTEGSDE